MTEHVEDRPSNRVDDPYENIPAFMICLDELASYGFPRPQGNGKTALHRQYNGTSSLAIAVINDEAGDIVTVYTDPQDNDWAGCAAAVRSG